MAKKNIFKPFLLLRLLGIILFVYILSQINIGEIGLVLSNLDTGLFLLGILFQIFVLLFKAVRWHLMNDGRTGVNHWILSTGRFLESYAIGVVTPGRLGELIKAGHEETKKDMTGAIIRVISERGFDVGIFVLAAGIALLSNNFFPIKLWITPLIMVTGIALLYISFLLLSSGKTLKLIQQLIRKISKKTKDIEIDGKQYSGKIVLLIFLLSVLSNLSYFISCFFLAQSVFLEVPFVIASGGVAIAGLLNMLPITIMGLGTREMVFLTVFQPFSESVILAFSATMLFVAQIGGGLFSMMLGQMLLLKKRKKK
jgi:glycosyltransferase 2 family protein